MAYLPIHLAQMTSIELSSALETLVGLTRIENLGVEMPIPALSRTLLPANTEHAPNRPQSTESSRIVLLADKAHQEHLPLPVGLGHTLQLVLLLDGIRVAATFGSIDQLLSKAFGNRLDISERCFTGTDCDESNGLVDTAQRGDIDGLSSDCSGGADTCAVFAGTAVDDGIDGDLDGVLVGHNVDLGVDVSSMFMPSCGGTFGTWTYDLE
jgi:hypothetical protein